MEQPLPPNGACLLGSFNLTRYCVMDEDGLPIFNYKQFHQDVKPIVRMMDNVIDNTIYPLDAQEEEAKSKRRMGLGITGFANACSFLGHEYGSQSSLEFLEDVLSYLRDESYMASVELAREKGAFPLFDRRYCESAFVKTLPLDIQAQIWEHGIRNSHLLSIAPTGTISLWANNISSGIEPVFLHSYNRNVYMPNGELKKFYLEDYAYSEWGLKGETSDEISVDAHINVLNTASRLVDSACSKTCNVGDEVTFDDFKNLYFKAFEGGASGCTTFRPSALLEGSGRGAVLERADKPDNGKEEVNEPVTEGAACFINEYGERQCAD